MIREAKSLNWYGANFSISWSIPNVILVSEYKSNRVERRAMLLEGAPINFLSVWMKIKDTINTVVLIGAQTASNRLLADVSKVRFLKSETAVKASTQTQ